MAGTYIDFSFTPTSGKHPLSCAFTPTEENADYRLVSCAWKFGDGETSNETSPTHIYNAPGVYYPYVTATYQHKTNGGEVSESLVSTTPVTVYEYGVSEGDLDGTVMDTSYQFAIERENGNGFSKNTGADWVLPEAESGSLLIYDEDGLYHGLVFDAKDGVCYEISMRDGPDGMDTKDYYEDKCSNSSENGTAIAPLIMFREDEGEQPHHSIELVSAHVFTQPFIPASGYISGTTFDVIHYKDGQQSHESTSSAKVEDVAVPDYEIISDRTLREAKRVQTQVTASQSKHLITGRINYYIAKDIPNDPTSNQTEERDHQLALASNLDIWITRGNNLLYDRIGKTAISGTVTALTGPDGKSNSGFQSTAIITLNNSAQASGMVLAWVKSTYQTIGGETMTQVSYGGSWYLMYKTTNITDSLALGAGGWFDIRVFSSQPSATDRTYMFNDTVYNVGRNILPRF